MRRAVSRWEIVGFSINDVIGSGVYLLPAAAAANLGSASTGAVVLAGLAVLLLVLCFAEAASYFDKPGSAYLYTREAFGERVGFQVGWMTWLARVSSVASLSVGFSRALGFLWPAANSGLGQGLAIAVPLLALTAINVVGVKGGARTAVFLAVTKTVPLLVFIAVGLFSVSVPLAMSVAPKEGGNLGSAVLLLLFAYAGFENTAAPAGEFKNPRRDVPFALIMQIGIVTVIYTAVQWVALGTLPGVADAQTPLANAAARFLGAWGGLLMTVGGVLSILGTNSNTVLAGPRYLYALAQDGFGPAALATLHPRYRTPTVTILTQTAIALPLAFSGSFEVLATLSVVARLATYFGTALSVPVLRRKLQAPANAFRIPGGPVIPLAAAALCVVFGLSAERENLIAGAIALAVGFVLYRFQRKPDGKAALG
ncbi:APC family permease [Corallococcus sp. EGB]|uniref:APC family permease n=1 Tax=Corallococcus sp. EGB TaxID=1521117 RepID=UPI001CBDAF33|nr:APC family permease [Corallococcus sp. EGB]